MAEGWHLAANSPGVDRPGTEPRSVPTEPDVFSTHGFVDQVVYPSQPDDFACAGYLLHPWVVRPPPAGSRGAVHRAREGT